MRADTHSRAPPSAHLLFQLDACGSAPPVPTPAGRPSRSTALSNPHAQTPPRRRRTAYSPDWSEQYMKWSDALRAQSRTMSFSCSWPAYYDFCTQRHPHNASAACGHDPWAPAPAKNTSQGGARTTRIAELCQLWRYGDDSDASWDGSAGSVAEILQAAATGQRYNMKPLNEVVDTGPGAWNDADFVSVGCPTDRLCGLGENAKLPMTHREQRAQFTMWAVLASPIILGADIRALAANKPALETLSNAAAIGISQDAAGVQGWRIRGEQGGPQVWVRPLARESDPATLRACCRRATAGAGAVAIALLNGGNASAARMAVTWKELGWTEGALAEVVWVDTAAVATGAGVSASVLPHQAVLLIVTKKHGVL